MMLPGKYGHAVAAIVPVATRTCGGRSIAPGSASSAGSSSAALTSENESRNEKQEADAAQGASKWQEEPSAGERRDRDQDDRHLERGRRHLQDLVRFQNRLGTLVVVRRLLLERLGLIEHVRRGRLLLFGHRFEAGPRCAVAHEIAGEQSLVDVVAYLLRLVRVVGVARARLRQDRRVLDRERAD